MGVEAFKQSYEYQESSLFADFHALMLLEIANLETGFSIKLYQSGHCFYPKP